MDTLLAAALLVVALLIVRAIAQIQRAESQQRRRTYRADVATRAVQRGARRGGDLEQDCLELWKLISARQHASRRAVMRSHEMSGYRWGKAMAVIQHLRLDPTQTPYRDGVEVIQEYFRTQARLARQTSFVPPLDHTD